MNESFIESFGSFNHRHDIYAFNEQNERIDSEKDLFIVMNEFEQESHTEQSKASM